MEDDTHLHDVCKRIIELDDKIRFAGIPNKFGKQIVVEYRKGLDPLLTDSESELYAIETVMPGGYQGPGGERYAPQISVTIFARGLLKAVTTRVFLAGLDAVADDPLARAIGDLSLIHI